MWENGRSFKPTAFVNWLLSFDCIFQEEYRRLEVLAFEMEATIASLEEELAAAYKEKDEVMSKCESLALELEVQSQNMSTSSSELTGLQEEISKLVSFDSS